MDMVVHYCNLNTQKVKIGDQASLHYRSNSKLSAPQILYE